MQQLPVLAPNVSPKSPICCLSFGADMASSVSKIIKKRKSEEKKKVQRCLSKHSLNIKYATRSLNIKYNTIAPHNVSTSD